MRLKKSRAGGGTPSPTFSGVALLYNRGRLWWLDAVAMFEMLHPGVLEGGPPDIEQLFRCVASSDFDMTDDIDMADLLKCSIIKQYWEVNPVSRAMFIDADPNS